MQLRDKPDIIFCSVGGGGLLGGLMEGCKMVSWEDGKDIIARNRLLAEVEAS